MSRLARRQPFFLPGVFEARKPFTFNGVKFERGDTIPHEKMGIDERKMRTLYDGRFLMRKETKEEIKTKESVKAHEEKTAKQLRAEKRRAARAEEE